MANAGTIPGVVLAGGRGRRMGRDKAFVTLAGQTLVARAVGLIAPQCGRLAINANGDPDRFTGLGLPGLTDGDRAGQGPLSGILAAMDWAAGLGAHRVLTVAVDTPFLPSDLLPRLAQEADGLVLAETANGVHGTTGLWPTDMREELRAALAGGTRKVTDWTTGQGAVVVRFPDAHPPPFFNVNTPEDLAQAEVWLRQV